MQRWETVARRCRNLLRPPVLIEDLCREAGPPSRGSSCHICFTFYHKPVDSLNIDLTPDVTWKYLEEEMRLCRQNSCRLLTAAASQTDQHHFYFSLSELGHLAAEFRDSL